MKVSKNLRQLLTLCAAKKHGNDLLSAMLKVNADGTVYLSTAYMEVPVYKIDASLLGVGENMSSGNYWITNDVDISALCKELPLAISNQLMDTPDEPKWSNRDQLSDEAISEALKDGFTLNVDDLVSMLPYIDKSQLNGLNPDLACVHISDGMVLATNGYYAKHLPILGAKSWKYMAIDFRSVLACVVAGCKELTVTGGFETTRRELVNMSKWIREAGDDSYEHVTYRYYTLSGVGADGNTVKVHTIRTECIFTEKINDMLNDFNLLPVKLNKEMLVEVENTKKYACNLHFNVGGDMVGLEIKDSIKGEYVLDSHTKHGTVEGTSTWACQTSLLKQILSDDGELDVVIHGRLSIKPGIFKGSKYKYLLMPMKW